MRATRTFKMLLSGVLILFGAFIYGCASITPVGQTTYSAVPASQVEVLYQEPPRPYEVIALVSYEAASRFATVPGVIEKCRELSAQAGADALIVTSSYDQTVNTAAKASG